MVGNNQVPDGGTSSKRKAAKPSIAAGTAQATANTTITSAGFVVGTVSTQNTAVAADLNKVAIAVTDTSVQPLGTAINYTINSPFFPPYFPPYFPPAFK